MLSPWFLKTVIGSLLLPPTNALLLLGLAGLFRKRRWAFGLAVLGGLLLLAQSLPRVADALIGPLERRAGPVLVEPAGAQAIVVLGSGLKPDAEEYGGDTLTDRSLIRLRYGALLARRHQLPVLVSGGQLPRSAHSEAEVMAEVMAKEFGVAVRWQESASQDTADNAAMSAQLLHAAGVRRILLVTQAFHMPRAERLFTASGLEVVPAPTDFMVNRRPPELLDWLPRPRALQTSYYALHEWLGLAWLDLRGVAGPAGH